MNSIAGKFWAIIQRGYIFIVVVGFGVMINTTYLFVGSIVRRYSRQNGEQTLSIMQDRIESDLLVPKTVLEVFSQSLSSMILRGADAGIIEERLREYAGYFHLSVTGEPYFSGVFGYFETLPGGAVFLSGDPSYGEKSPASQSWYTMAAAANGRIIQTPTSVDALSGKPYFVYAVSLLDEEARRTGVIGIKVNLDQTGNYIIRVGLREGGYGLLLNSQGEIIAHPTFAPVTGKMLSEVDEKIAQIMGESQYGILFAESRTRDYRDTDVLVFPKRIDGGWYVAFVVPYSKFYEERSNLLNRLIFLGVALSAALCFILLYFTRAKVQSDTKNQQKSSFLATMSHEIRTPMNAIMGITEIQLQDENLPQGLREGLSKIQSSGDLLLGIINDILDLSKIDAGKMELVSVNYQVASLINDVVQLNKLRFESKPIDFKLLVDEKIPAILVGDELRIKQILNNLLSNAFKYTERGEILFSVAVEYPRGGVAAHVTLVFRVKDTGQGMTADQVKKLGDEYSRFNLEANRTTQGTGLGMSITRNLLRLMNGNLHVESSPGRGTTVTVYLPQRITGIGVSGMLGRDIADNLQEFRGDGMSQVKKAQINYEFMSYGSVLIVDDVESNLYVAKGLMTPYGLSIDTAISGFEAIEKVKAGRAYDIIFMDHMMPKVDGIEAVKIIRELGYVKPIVALTANALAGHADMFLANGFDDFISKPIDMRQLNASLNRLIRDKQPRDVLDAARKKKIELDAKASGKTLGPSLDPELIQYFIEDAERIISATESICANEFRRADDIQMYVTCVHGIKSALANIAEKELSAFALRLEQAGKDQNTAVMIGETPVFMNALRELLVRLRLAAKSPDAEKKSSETPEDTEYLREKLFVLQAACGVYSKKMTGEVMSALSQKTWPDETAGLLKKISALLESDGFEEAAKTAKDHLAEKGLM